ncbi:MAG: hypothetical protein AAF637_01495 [Pseudomonadota bacterium]
MRDLREIKRQIKLQRTQLSEQDKAQYDAEQKTTEYVVHLLLRWNSDIAWHQDDIIRREERAGPLTNVQRAYERLRPDQRDFVARRLLAEARSQARRSGRAPDYKPAPKEKPVPKRKQAPDDVWLAKTATKLIDLARSDAFAGHTKQERKAQKRCLSLAGSARRNRRSDIKRMVTDSARLDDAARGMAQQMKLGSGKNLDDDREVGVVMDAAIGDADFNDEREHALDKTMHGLSMAEADAAYRRTMGSQGNARAILFAANLIGRQLDDADDNDRKTIRKLNAIRAGVEQTVVALADKGHNPDAPREIGQITEAFEAGLRQKHEANAKRRFVNLDDEEIIQQAKKELPNHTIQNWEATAQDPEVLRRALIKKHWQGPVMGDLDDLVGADPFEKELEGDLDAAMKLAGIADKDLVRTAYQALLHELDIDPTRRVENDDGVVSVVSLDDS